MRELVLGWLGEVHWQCLAGTSNASIYPFADQVAIIHYGHSSVASAYIKRLSLDLQVPRATYIEEADDEKHEPIVHWVENLDEATANEGEALLTEELVAIYEADSVPFGEKNESPFCRIHITLPPSINDDFTVRRLRALRGLTVSGLRLVSGRFFVLSEVGGRQPR